MSWALAAHGETNPDDEDALREWLADVLSDPRFGTLSSQWSGGGNNGPLHTQPVKADGGSGSST